MSLVYLKFSWIFVKLLIAHISMWMEKSLIGMPAWQGVEKDFSYLCQELGESKEKFSSHMAHAEPLSPSHSSMWLILFSPSCLSLFPTTDTRKTPTAPREIATPRDFSVASPVPVTLLGFSFGIWISSALAGPHCTQAQATLHHGPCHPHHHHHGLQ